MTQVKYIFRSILIIVLLAPLFVAAQNNTSSPYSKFGTGDLSNVAYGRNLALGGTGFALRSASQLNLKNPASLTAIDSLSVLFETGVFGKFTQNSSVERSLYYWDGNITHLTFGHRYTPWLMGGYGLMPFSDIGYAFRTSKSVEGEISPVYTDWTGSGGITKLFYSLGLKINKNFSLGGELAYYYGPLNERRKTTALVEPNNPSYFYTNTRYSGISYKGAFQYSANLDKKGTNLTIGGVFSPAQLFTGKTKSSIEQSYSSSVVVPVFSEETYSDPVKLPMTYGAGASFVWKAKYLLTADYELAGWNENKATQYIDQQIYSVGLERLPQNSLKYFQRCSYRVGFRYDSGYFQIKNKAIDDVRLTVGAGFPLKKTRSTMNVTLEAGQRGTMQLGMLRERYTKMTVAFSFHDYWFIKRKID